MKKAISLLMIIVMMAALNCGCADRKRQVSVYFRDKITNTLNEEKRNVEAGGRNSVREVARLSVEELIKGPVNEINAPVISKEAKLLGLDINEKVATVNLSEHYDEKKGVEALLLRFALVNTLCSIEGIDGIVIQVEGKPITSASTGKEVGVLSINDITLDIQNNQNTEKTTICLYFPSSEDNLLKQEKRSVEIHNALSIEKTVVSELIKGPQKSELMPSLSSGTKLLGIETKDKVCYVNFSSEFVSKDNSGSLSTTLTLYSVVNSLCEIDGVEEVKILVNGETGTEFGNYVLDIPYEANMDYVG
jgi:germination protein M